MRPGMASPPRRSEANSDPLLSGKSIPYPPLSAASIPAPLRHEPVPPPNAKQGDLEAWVALFAAPSHIPGSSAGPASAVAPPELRLDTTPAAPGPHLLGVIPGSRTCLRVCLGSPQTPKWGHRFGCQRSLCGRRAGHGGVCPAPSAASRPAIGRLGTTRAVASSRDVRLPLRLSAPTCGIVAPCAAATGLRLGGCGSLCPACCGAVGNRRSRPGAGASIARRVTLPWRLGGTRKAPSTRFCRGGSRDPHKKHALLRLP